MLLRHSQPVQGSLQRRTHPALPALRESSGAFLGRVTDGCAPALVGVKPVRSEAGTSLGTQRDQNLPLGAPD